VTHPGAGCRTRRVAWIAGVEPGDDGRGIKCFDRQTDFRIGGYLVTVPIGITAF
jgi:hypothetical protein